MSASSPGPHETGSTPVEDEGMPSLQEIHNEKIVEQFTFQAKPFAEAPIHSASDSLELLLEVAEVNAEDDVLDVACGTGIVSCAAAKAAKLVRGIDLVPAMLEQARQLQAEKRIANVTWECGDVTKLPFADESFSLVITRYTFHHFVEAPAVIAEMARVCKRGGRVVIADVTPSEEKRDRFDAMERLRDRSHASAFTLDELKELGRNAGLTFKREGHYDLETGLEPLLAASHSSTADQDRIRQMVREDIGIDLIGIKSFERRGQLGFLFPVSIIAWSK